MSIRHYFNFISPASFAAHIQLRGSAARDCFEERPIFIPEVMIELPEMVTPLTVSERRLDYDLMDMARRISHEGVDPRPGIQLVRDMRAGLTPLAPAKAFDSGPVCAGYDVADRNGAGRSYVDRVFRAFWEEGRLITSEPVLAEIAGELGLDAPRFWSSCWEPETVEGNIRRALTFLEEGGVGVPFFVHGPASYWGSDRVDWVLASLRGGTAPQSVRRVGEAFTGLDFVSDSEAAEVGYDFSFACPYSYISAGRWGEVMDVPRPRVFGRAWGFREGGWAAAVGPNKAPYQREDVRRHAAAYGLPLCEASLVRPLTGSAAAAGFELALDRGKAHQYTRAVMQAAWAKGIDIDDRQQLAEVLERADLDGRWAWAKETAVRFFDRGAEVFGLPLFRLGGESFWGNDRLEFLASRLQGAVVSAA